MHFFISTVNIILMTFFLRVPMLKKNSMSLCLSCDDFVPKTYKSCQKFFTHVTGFWHYSFRCFAISICISKYYIVKAGYDIIAIQCWLYNKTVPIKMGFFSNGLALLLKVRVAGLIYILKLSASECWIDFLISRPG